MPVLTKPGFYELSAAEYHAGPCPEPELSCSIAKLLIRASPLHAWYAHPKLGGYAEDDPSRAMDAGSVIHRLILGRGADLEVIDVRYGKNHSQAGELCTDWRTTAAAAARDAARAAGKIPVLAVRYPGFERAAAAAQEYLQAHPDCGSFFAPGGSERTMIAHQEGIWFKSLADRCPDDPTLPLFDIKTTEGSAAPAVFARRIQTEFAFQDAFYRRVRRWLTGEKAPPMRFVVVEIDPPHGVSVVTVDDELCALADREVSRAITVWSHCMRTEAWPAYPMMITEVPPARWQLLEYEQQLIDEAVQGGEPYVPRHRREADSDAV